MTQRHGIRRFGWLAVVWVLLALLPGAASAAYPDKPIKLIVPWAAGGDTDAILRVWANAMEKHLGQPVVVVNITGASGTVGAREAKRRRPTGTRSTPSMTPSTPPTTPASRMSPTRTSSRSA